MCLPSTRNCYFFSLFQMYHAFCTLFDTFCRCIMRFAYFSYSFIHGNHPWPYRAVLIAWVKFLTRCVHLTRLPNCVILLILEKTLWFLFGLQFYVNLKTQKWFLKFLKITKFVSVGPRLVPIGPRLVFDCFRLALDWSSIGTRKSYPTH